MQNSGTAPTGLTAVKELVIVLFLGALVYFVVFVIKVIVFFLVDIPEFFNPKRA